MKYFFQTSATMKEYNNKKWWIDSDIIKNIIIEAESVDDAILIYKEHCNDKHGVNISANAIKNKEPIYTDTETGAEQCGYILTAKTDFCDDNNYKWTAQYIDLWVNISIVQNPFTMEGGGQ